MHIQIAVMFINHPFFCLSMKLTKSMKRLCPTCKKHTEHKVINQKFKGLNKAHPQSKGSKTRAMKRGQRRGHGGHGRFSRPPIASWKMTGSKTSKKTDLRYQCGECKKTHMQKRGFRVKKLEFREK
jgi:large subunit ribosomal protein L44e